MRNTIFVRTRTFISLWKSLLVVFLFLCFSQLSAYTKKEKIDLKLSFHFQTLRMSMEKMWHFQASKDMDDWPKEPETVKRKSTNPIQKNTKTYA